MNYLSTKAGACKRNSWLTRLLLAALILMGAGLSAKAAPALESVSYSEDAYFFPFRSDAIKVTYTEPVIKTYWALEQDGTVVLEGTCDGKSMNQAYANINMKTALGNAVADKTVKLGKATFKITKVEYGEDEVATNLGSVEWNITDAPLCNAMSPYPVPEGNALTEIKSNTTCSFQGPTGTFMGGSTQLKQVKARLVQNGRTIAEEVIFNGTLSVASGKYTYSASNKLASDPVWESVGAGAVEIQFYEVTYISPVDGEEKVFNVQPALPAKFYTGGAGIYVQEYKGVAITRGEKKVEAKSNFISESLAQYTGTIKSYYPADGTEGVITFTTDLAIDPTNLHAELSYGNMDIPFTKTVPASVSADGKTLSIDLRGMLNSQEALTGGYQFVDDNGNPVAGPTQISLDVTGLDAVGGGSLCDLLTPPEGGNPITRWGKLWRTYSYQDITFNTPKLVTAQFYNQAAPEMKSDAILANTDMMDLTVSDDDVISSAKLVFTAGETVETVEWSNITRSNGVWTAALPAAIKAAGSSALVISLTDVEYNKVDGAEHVVAPLDVAKNGGAVKQVATVAELKALDEGLEFLLSTETLKVTLADADMGLVTVEDETGGLMLDPSGYLSFEEGKLVKGNIGGTYLGTSMVSINAAKSNFTQEDTDVATGLLVTDPAELVNAENVYRLITVNATEDITIEYSEDADGVVINDMVVARDALSRIPADYTFPENIGTVTGVYYSMGEETFLILRSTSDVVEASKPIEGIAAALAVQSEEPFTMKLTDAKATFSAADYGMTFVEDATGAAIFVMEDGEFAQRGQLLNGEVTVMNYGGGMIVALDKSALTVGEADVTLGKVITADEVGANNSRLVTFTSDNSTFYIDADSEMILVDWTLVAVDRFENLPAGYVWPSEIQSLTGVAYYDPDMEQTMLYIRDENDIVAVPQAVVADGIAAALAVQSEEPFTMKLTDAKVTFSYADAGMTFVEDATGAAMIAMATGGEFGQRGQLLNGEVTVMSMYGSLIAFDKSALTIGETDVTLGKVITGAQVPENTSRLVTFTSENSTLVVDRDSEMVLIDGEYIAADMLYLLEGYEWPAAIESLTGIAYYSPDMDQTIIIIRDANDIVAAPSTPVCNSIAELKTLEEGTEVILTLNNAKITHQMPGYNFLEDETGAIIIPEIELSSRGKSLTGTIKGIYVSSMMALYVEDASHIVIDNEEDVDVAKGMKLSAAELGKAEHHYRLVTFDVADGHTIVGDSTMGQVAIDNSIYAVDMFEVLPDDYEYPETISSVTGIIYPMNNLMSADDLYEEPAPVMIIIRDANDIVKANTDGIYNISIDELMNGDIYTLGGIKVNKNLNELTDGVYIINGQKVYLKK